MNMIASRTVFRDRDFAGTSTATSQGVVAIVSGNEETVAHLAPVCDFLDLRVEVVSAGTELAQVLQEQRPMAVITDVDAGDQDGFHVMKQVARHNRELPILLLTDGDAAMMGAADAVQDLWGLTSVTRTSEFPLAGQLVAFLFSAGRKAGGMRLVPV